MATTYRCREGDILDWICWKHYGRTRGAVEAVLEANSGLAEYDPHLPAGLKITLPDLSPAEDKEVVRLWS